MAAAAAAKIPKELTEEEKEKLAVHEKAEVEKKKAAELYKAAGKIKKDPEAKAAKVKEALEGFTRAAEIEPTNMAYLNNRAACMFELKQYDECREECKKAVELGRSERADYQMIAKALARAGNCHYVNDQWKEAIDLYDQSLLEDHDDKVYRKKMDAKKKLKAAEQAAFLSPDKAEEETEKGNEKFKEGDFHGALKHYTEAIARDPKNHKLYSNRCAAFQKIGQMPAALEDCEKCIALDPAPTARAQAVFARVATFMEQRQVEHGSTVGAPDTGLAPGSSSLSSVQVTEDCQVILREVYLCTTGGRLWQAALLLANHLLSNTVNCDAVAHCCKSGGRLIEVGAGLGLVGLALACAVAGSGCTVTLTDCEMEALDNLRQEVLLNSHHLIDATCQHSGCPEPEPEPQQGVIFPDSGTRTDNGCGIAVAELNYGPQDAVASSEALTKGGQARYDLVVGSDVIFSETHASLSTALGRLMAIPDGKAVLCLADNRVGVPQFLQACEDEGLLVSVRPVTPKMLAQARLETDDDDLGSESMGREENTHSLYYVQWAPTSSSR